MSSANVRISNRSHATLQRLSREENCPMQSILDSALEQYRRERFLHEANSDFARLKKNPKAWGQEAAERDVWDATLEDASKF